MKNIYSIVFILILSITVIFPIQALAFSYNWIQWTPLSYHLYWTSIAISANGNSIVASDNINAQGPLFGYIYTSIDAGATWIERRSAGLRHWNAVASSANGQNLVAVEGGTPGGPSTGYIYTSSDAGVTWVQRVSAGAKDWKHVSISADGNKLAATGYLTTTIGYVYVSLNQGATWTQAGTPGPRGTLSSVLSTDGSKIAAPAIFSGTTNSIEQSTDSGTTWSRYSIPNNPSITAPVAMSSNGSKQVAGADTFAGTAGGYVYTSNDAGVNWVTQASLGRSGHWNVTSSSDGMNLAVSNNTTFDGYVYTSSDSGATWNIQTALNNHLWGRIVSSDNANILAVVDTAANGSIWIGTLSSACPTSLSATTDSGGFHLFANISNFLLNAFGFNFCISNSSANHYFIPTKTSAELQSFINAVPRLNGVSTTTQ